MGEDESAELDKISMDTIWKILHYQSHVWLYPVAFALDMVSTVIEF